MRTESVATVRPGTLSSGVRRLFSNPELWAAATAVLTQRMLHAAFHEAPFAPYAAAEYMIRKSPGPIATWAIEELGHRAQPALGYSFIALTLLIGLLLGRRPAWVLAAAAFVLTMVAGYLDPLTDSAGWTITSGVVAALTAFLAVVAFQRRPTVEATPEMSEARRDVDWARRRLMARAGLGLVFVGVGGTALLKQGSGQAPTERVFADTPVTIPKDGSFPRVVGLSPRVTSRDDHYTVDIDLENPFVSESSWRLEIDGAVDNALSFTLEDLEAMPTTEVLFNLSCISNEIGGRLIGNSRWTGVSFDRLLDMAGARPEAVAIEARARDDYTDVILLDDIVGHGALVAIAMNGRQLPRDHGFPARMLFPDHYGMRNVKWLTQITLLDHTEQGYWAARGWDKDAVVRTMSRIDAPDNGDSVASRFVCAGVAWAGERGIRTVEVSADGGDTWRAAQLEAELSDFSWRRWQIELDLPAGSHQLVARATDGTGMVQEERERDPHPSGASGYHQIRVNVG